MLEPFYGPLQPAAAAGAVQRFTVQNESGTGQVTVCPVFAGAELCYNEMRLAYCNRDQRTAPRVIEMNYCLTGRYECSFGENSCCYLGAGDFAASAATRRKSASCFPLRHYRGITLLLDLDALTAELRQGMVWLGIAPARLEALICGGNRCCILRQEPALERIFSDLYAADPAADGAALRLKVLELLQLLSRPETLAAARQADYLNHTRAARAKQAAALITQDLTAHYTIEALARAVGLSPTALKADFKGVYGSSIYAYLRAYGLQTAQKLLAETALPVAEIAHRVGYENPNKFASAFRAAFGTTPTAYRKACPNG